MTAPDILPTLSAPDCPTCSGEECPACTGWMPSYQLGLCVKTNLLVVAKGNLCLPGLRRLLAERTEDLSRWRSDFQALAVVEKETREERDAARRLYCAYRGAAQGDSKRFAPIIADELGWQHLYAPAPPATGEEEP